MADFDYKTKQYVYRKNFIPAPQNVIGNLSTIATIINIFENLQRSI